MTFEELNALPHLVVLRTNGRVLQALEYASGLEAHKEAVRLAKEEAAGEIIVCTIIRRLESLSHRFRHEEN